MTPPHIVILGPMGVGKSTTARRLAARIDRPMSDSDHDIERLFGRSGAAIAKEFGVETLHEIERAVLLGALATEEPRVIAAAASVVESEYVRLAVRRRSWVAYLDAPLEEILERQASGGHRRPMDSAELATLLERRAPWVDSLDPHRFDATRPIDEVVRSMVAGLPADRP